jgi:uncharacterized protein YrzB (UPF0473 family)
VIGPDDEDDDGGEEIGFDEGAELDEADLVTLVDDDGNQLECLLLAVVDHEGRSYAVLTPRVEEDDEETDGAGDLLLATFDEDASGAARFGPVEDDEVVKALRRLIAQLVDLEEEEGGEGTIFGGPVPEA